MDILRKRLEQWKTEFFMPVEKQGVYKGDYIEWTRQVYVFYGAQGTKLDDWAETGIVIEGREFSTSEHVISAVCKAGYFKDAETLRVALANGRVKPYESRAIGFETANYDGQAWRTAKPWISDVTVLHKCLQNEDVMNELMQTGKRQIISHGRYGPSREDSLMRVREYLKGVLAGKTFPITSEENLRQYFGWFSNKV